MLPNGGYLLGDSAYALTTYVMNPFPHPPISHREARFNKLLSSMRMAVERVYGQLKGHWRMLKTFIPCTDYPCCVKIIHVCCILHKICIDRENIRPDDEMALIEREEEQGPEAVVNAQDGIQKREYLAHLALDLY